MSARIPFIYLGLTPSPSGNVHTFRASDAENIVTISVKPEYMRDADKLELGRGYAVEHLPDNDFVTARPT